MHARDTQLETKADADGDLRVTPFAHLLLYAHERRLSGTLLIGAAAQRELSVATCEAAVVLHGGLVAGVRVAGPGLSIDPEVAVTGAQTLAWATALCARDHGRFVFIADRDLLSTREGERLTLDPYAVIARSLRGAARDPIVQQVVDGLGQRLVNVRGDAPLERFALDSDELAFVNQLARNPSPASQIIFGSQLPPARVRRVLYLLRITRCLVLTPAARHAMSGPVRISQPPTDATVAQFKAQLQEGLAQAPIQPQQTVEAGVARPGEAAPVPSYAASPSAAGRTIVAGSHAAPVASGPTDRPVDSAAGTTAQAGEEEGEVAVSAQQEQEAAELFRRAERALSHSRTDEAFSLSDRAFALDPRRPEHCALHAWLIHVRAGQPIMPSEESVRLITQALKHNPGCEHAHLYKAKMLKRSGRSEQAARHFRRALQANPDNLEAARELRLYSMRKQQSEGKPKLIERIFRLSSAPKRNAG